jgi:hypothetical protein
MSVSAEFLPEFDQEMAAARRTLERIPEDKLAWKPHEKSMTLGRLAGHIAELPGMGVKVMNEDALDFANRPAGEPPRKRSRRSMCWNCSIRMLRRCGLRLRAPAMRVGRESGHSRRARKSSTTGRAWGRCGG